MSLHRNTLHKLNSIQHSACCSSFVSFENISFSFKTSQKCLPHVNYIFFHRINTRTDPLFRYIKLLWLEANHSLPTSWLIWKPHTNKEAKIPHVRSIQKEKWWSSKYLPVHLPDLKAQPAIWRKSLSVFELNDVITLTVRNFDLTRMFVSPSSNL